MICEKFSNLNAIERIAFIGELQHVAMSNDIIFDMANDLIDIGRYKGFLDGVVIMPEPIKLEEVVSC